MLREFFDKHITTHSRQNTKLNKQLSFYGVIVVSAFLPLIIILIFVSLIYTQNENFLVFAQTKNNINNSSKTTLTIPNLINQGSPYYGNTFAPLAIIDFSDFQCYLCKRYVDNTESQVNSTLIQTGKAIYIFKHLPNRGFDSKPAALAAQCTNDQGKFWDFHKILYRNQGPIDSGWANSENLKKFALQLAGFNMTKFISCFDSKKYEVFVNKDIAMAHSLGFTETPSFIIMNSDGSNIQKIEGPKPFPIFKTVIDNLKNGNNTH